MACCELQNMSYVVHNFYQEGGGGVAFFCLERCSEVVCKLTEKIQEIGDNSLHHQILAIKFHFHATFASQVQHFGSSIATSEEVKALHHKELDD